MIFPQYVIENYSLSFLTFEEGELHLFNLDQDPYEEVDLAVEKEEKLNGMKELAREWAADLKVAFQPNRFPPEVTFQFCLFQVQPGLPSLSQGTPGAWLVQAWLVEHTLEAGKLCHLFGKNLIQMKVFIQPE